MGGHGIPSDGLKEFSPDELGLEVLGEYPLGSFTLTLFSGDTIDDVVLFDGSADYIKVRESGTVGIVEVYNYSEKHVFIPHGVIVSGVSQDRVIRRPVIVPPAKEEPYRLPAYCVEAGRGLTKAMFSESLLAPLDFRAMILSSGITQRDVWSNIRKRISYMSRSIGVPEHIVRAFCPTESMAMYTRLATSAMSISKRALFSEFSNTMKMFEEAKRYLRLVMDSIDRIKARPRIKFGHIELWLERIARVCEWGVKHFKDEEMPRRAILADLYGLLHVGNRPKSDDLSPVERVRLETILRRIISVISKYTNMSVEVIFEYLEKPGEHRILARKTMGIDIPRMLREILDIVSSVGVRREIYDELERDAERLHKEIREIRRQILGYLEEIEALYSRALSIESRLGRDIIWELGKRICKPEYFGVEYKEEAIGYSVSKNGRVICVEMMPTNMTKKLWTEIFQSIILYIVVGSEVGTERMLEEPKTTTEKLLNRYTLTIHENGNQIVAEIRSRDRIIYYFEAHI